jgi:hypothetical protein
LTSLGIANWWGFTPPRPRFHLGLPSSSEEGSFEKISHLQSLIPLLIFLCVFWLVFSGSFLAQQPPADSSSPIKGRVTAENGRGAPQAMISLRRVGGLMETMRWTNSDADGNFQFNSLAEGAYHLSASSPGYVPAEDPFTGKPESVLYYPGDFASLSVVKGGVITGTVTDAAGNPAVNAQVAALPLEKKRVETAFRPFPFIVNDRGIFRIYGLATGIYQVRAGGSDNSYLFSAYDGLVPSFYSVEADGSPSRVEVRTGLEISGVDIRLRPEFGHAIRGELAIAPSLDSSKIWATIFLIQAESGSLVRTSATGKENLAWKFALSHVPDGNYFLLARTLREAETPGASDPVAVTVRGQDIGGIRLTVNPLGSLAGRVVLEPAAAGTGCTSPASGWMKALVLSALRLSNPKETRLLEPFFPAEAEAVIDAKGNFQLADLFTGNHYLRVHLPSRALYLKSVLPVAVSTAPNNLTASTSRLVFPVGRGSAGNSIKITLAQGAAEISGKLAVKEGETTGLGSRRVFLIPAEEEARDNILRYAETRADGEGKFLLRNLAPGEYRLIAWPEANLPGGATELPSYFSTSFRQKLRQAAAREHSFTLKPCQSSEIQLR